MSNKPKNQAKTPVVKKTISKKSKNQVERETRQSLQKLINWLKKRQGIIVTLILMISLGAIILLMSNIFDYANDASGDLELDTNINFDQKTIDQIIELDKVNDQVPTINNSAGRINPFSDR